MMAIIAIAHNTFLESVRKLELVLFLVLGSFLVLSVCYLSTNEQALGTIVRFMNDQSYVEVTSPGGVWDTSKQVERSILAYLKASGMFFNEVFTLIIAFAMTLFLIPGEIASGAILNILPKPVRRHEYIIGKFLGVVIVVTFAWIVMGLELFLFFTLRERMVDKYLITAVLLLPLKFAIFIAFMITLTTRMPSIAAGVISLVFFVTGHVSSKIQDFYLDPELAFKGIMKYLAMIAYYITPHLHPVFSGTMLDPNENVLETWDRVFLWAVYAIFYMLIILSIGIFSFRRRSI